MTRPSPSLRARFALAMLVWVAIGLVMVGTSATLLFRRHVEALFHAELQEHLVELAGLTSFDAAGRPALSRPLSDPRYGEPGSGYYWQVSRDDGAIARSPSLGRDRFDDNLAHQPAIVHVEGAGPAGEAMIYGIARPHPSPGGTVHFIIATDMRHLDEAVGAFRQQLVAWLLAMASLLIGGALVALRFATRPLDRLGARIAKLRTGAAQGLGDAWPAEIAPLASDLDRLIESREAMVTSARIEAGNLAHGLRTSLAILTDEAEGLAGSAAGAILLNECRAMTRKLDWHLARARAAAGQGPVIETRLPDALAPLLSAMGRLHAARGISFAAEGPAAAVLIDPEAFAEILSNLLDNAGKWATRAVMLRWQPQGDLLQLDIVDDGAGIPADVADTLWQPGVRLDEQVPGHGLGLAIARDLVLAAGGGLDLGPRGDGAPGTRARLTLQLQAA